MAFFLKADTWMQGLFLLTGFIAALWTLRADLRLRKLNANAFVIAFLAGAAGLAGAFFARQAGLAWFGGVLGGIVAVTFVAWSNALSIFELFDACAPAASVAYAIISMGALFYAPDWTYRAVVQRLVRSEPMLWWLVAVLLWQMGTRATLGPKAKGEIFATYLMVGGALQFLFLPFHERSSSHLGLLEGQYASLFTFLAGGILLGYVLSRFHALSKEHRILQHATGRGDVVQPEYHRPTPECPHPERWRMYDSMTAEVEVLDFLKTLVTTIKPELVVETGTFLGISTLHIAEGLRENGFGRVITCEYDPKVFEEAKKRFHESGLTDWIDLRNVSSLEIKIEGRIDLLYCDSDLPLREQEVRRFLPQINPHGLILMHDASSSLKTVREAAQKLEREGLLSIVLLPTPRGLVMAQKREGRA